MTEVTDFESLEDALQLFAQTIEDEREANWQKGDIALSIVNYFGPEAIGKLAETAHCSIHRIYHLLYNAKTFPPEKRAKDYNWTFHLTVAYRAKAIGMEPEELLDMAIKNGWTAKDVKNYMSDKKPESLGSFKCMDCGAKITIKAPEDFKGRKINCPFCGKYLGNMI